MSTLVLGLLHSNLGQCLTSPGSLRGESLCREGPPGPPSSPRPGQTGSRGGVRGLMPGPEVQTDRVPELGATSGGALATTTDAVAGGRKSKVPAGGCPARPPSHQALAWPPSCLCLFLRGRRSHRCGLIHFHYLVKGLVSKCNHFGGWDCNL